MEFRCVRLLVLTVGWPVNAAVAEEPGVIATMDVPRFQAPKEHGRSEIVQGKIGKATRFHFDKDSSSTFFTSNIHGNPEWDRSAGFSFWAKGNGAAGIGGLEFIYDDDYAVRYDVGFPYKAGEWTKVMVAWDDLIPVLQGPRQAAGSAGRQSALENHGDVVGQVVVLG